MTPPLPWLDSERLLAVLRQSMILDDCATCECFHGFLTQLKIDRGEEMEKLLAPFSVDRSELHGCLGCEPCPPANLFAAYSAKRPDPPGD